MHCLLKKRPGFVPTATMGFALLLILFVTTQNGYAGAEEYHSREDIQSTAETFLRSHLKSIANDKSEVHIGTLDNRLKLNRCDQPLQAFLPPGARMYGKTTVGVRCEGNRPWKIFVPAKLAVFENVVVVSRPIVRGETLGATDLKLVSKEVSPASQTYMRDIQHAVGYIAKRSIPAGRILTAQMVQAPRLIKAGQEVILLATTPQLEVRMKGKALSDGSRGDIIQVRNVRSKRIIEGVVTDIGTVRVNM